MADNRRIYFSYRFFSSKSQLFLLKTATTQCHTGTDSNLSLWNLDISKSLLLKMVLNTTPKSLQYLQYLYPKIGFTHITSGSYYTQSNGLAGKTVKTVVSFEKL